MAAYKDLVEVLEEEDESVVQHAWGDSKDGPS